MKNLINKLFVMHRGELFGRLLFVLDKKTKRYDRFVKKNTKELPEIKKIDIFANESELLINDEPFFLSYGEEKIDIRESTFVDNNKKWYKIKESDYHGDIREYWERGRLQNLNFLLSNYLITKENGLLADIDDLLDKWLKNNPIDCGYNHCSNLEIAIRFLVLYRVYYYIGDKIKTNLHIILYRYGLHLFFDLHRTNLCVPNNHSLGEATSLLLASKIFTNKKWEKYAKKTIVKRIELINECGETIEESSGYHLFVTQMLIVILSITDEFDKLLIPKITKSIFLLNKISDKEGNIGKFGDCDDGLFFVFDNFYRNNIKAVNPVFLKSFKKIGEYIKKCSENANTNQSNYICVIETGKWKVALIGGYEINHAHTQCLSFLAWLNGVQVVFSPGTYRYNGSQEKLRYSLSSQEFSNSPSSNLTNRNNFVTKFRHKKTIKRIKIYSDGAGEIVGEMEYNKIKIIRKISIVDDGITIYDELHGGVLLPFAVCLGTKNNHVYIPSDYGHATLKYASYSRCYGVVEKGIYYIINNNLDKNMVSLKCTL